MEAQDHPESTSAAPALPSGCPMGGAALQIAPTPVNEAAGPELIAYRVTDHPAFTLVRAPLARQWMDKTRDRFANRCLPLLIANQAGWHILNSVPIRASWTGGWDKACIRIESLDGSGQAPACLSHFGEGVLTWHMPWLFRTPPGYNLLARGPANLPKDGICALEGIVETDWTLATFTMNWQFTAKNTPVTFEKDEPICMILPQRRGELEQFHPSEKLITDEPEMAKAYAEWSAGREQFLRDLRTPGTEARRKSWEKHYFQGITRDGTIAPEHQSKLNLQEFNMLAPRPAPTSADAPHQPPGISGS